VWCGGCSVGIAKASKDAQVGVIGSDTEEESIGCFIATRTARAPVEKICGCRKGVRPERAREGSLEHECTNAIIEGAKDAFGTPVLLGCVRARETQRNAMFSIECTRGRVVKLLAIICLHTNDRTLKLRLNKGMKGNNSRKNIRLVP
jgi:hypothetical protein